MKRVAFAVVALLVLALGLVGFTGSPFAPLDSLKGPDQPYSLSAELETAVSAREKIIVNALAAAGLSGQPLKANVIRSNQEMARSFLDNPGVTVFVKSDDERRSAALALVEQLRGTGAQHVYVQVEPWVTLEQITVDQSQTDKETLPQPKQQVTGPAGVMKIDLTGLDNRNLRMLDSTEFDRLSSGRPGKGRGLFLSTRYGKVPRVATRRSWALLLNSRVTFRVAMTCACMELGDNTWGCTALYRERNLSQPEGTHLSIGGSPRAVWLRCTTSDFKPLAYLS